MSDDLVKHLRYGIVEHRKRWSGDTRADMGGSVDYDATCDLMNEAADRIAELEAKLAKTVGALGDIGEGEPEWPDDPQKELDWARNRACHTLKELEGETE